MKKRWARRHIVEAIFKVLMLVSFAVVAGSLTLILWTIVSKGLPALSWAMLTQTPTGGYYLGKTGGILNAILGVTLHGRRRNLVGAHFWTADCALPGNLSG